MKTNKFNIPVYTINDHSNNNTNYIRHWNNKIKSRWINYNIFGIRIKIRYEKQI